MKQIKKNKPNKPAKLKAKSKRLQHMVSEALDVIHSQIVVLNQKGIIIYFNKAWEDFGKKNNPSNDLPKNASLGVNYLNVLLNSKGKKAKEAKPAYLGIMSVLSGKKKSFLLEYPCHSKNEKRWFLMNVTPLAKKKGVVIIHQNITERVLLHEKRGEKLALLERLTHNEILLGRFINLVPGGFGSYKISPEGKIYLLYGNKGWEDIFEMKVQEAEKDATPVLQKIFPEDVAKLFEKVHASAKSLTDIHMEFRVKSKNKGIKYIDTFSALEKQNDGSYLLSGFGFDITVQKKEEQAKCEAEEKLHTSEEKYRLLAENTGFPVASVDASGTFLFVNKQFAEIFNSEPHLMIGQTMQNSMGAEFAEPRMKIILQVIATNTPYADEETKITHGKTKWFKRNFRPIIGWEKTPQVLITGTDITEQKTETEKQQQLAIELEKRVEERTCELKEALGKERELTEMKSKFITTTSHEFRTPLSTISLATGFLRKFRKQVEDKIISDKLEAIDKQVKHMSHLLQDVLTIGKNEAGMTSVSFTKIPFPAFFSHMVEEVIESLNTHSVFSQFDCVREWICSDEKLLRNIVINLLDNAIKFSPGHDRVDLLITCSQSHLNIYVHDNGIGIGEEDKLKLCNPFQRGANVGSIQGTGLGLSIVKNAVDLLSGTLSFESSKEKGTTFIVSIPVFSNKCSD